MSKKVKLQEYIQIQNGYAFKSNLFQNFGIPVVRITNVENGKLNLDKVVYYPEDKKLDRFIIKKNDILLSLTGDDKTLKVCMNDSDEKIYLNQRVAILRSNESLIQKYLYYSIKKYSSLILEKAKGIAQKNISVDDINSLEVPLPSIEKQKQIAKTLDKANELIELRKESITKLDALAKSIFIDMFGDPVSNPKGWETKKLKEIIILQRGHDLPTNQRDLDGEIDLYGASGLSGKHNIAKVFGGGIITGRSGTIGQVNYTKKDFWPLNTTLFSKETFNNNLIFLCYLLRFLKLENYANYTSVPTLNRNIIHEIEVYDISIDLQNKFAKIIEKIEEQKSLYEKELEKLQINFDALLQKSFQE